MSDLNLLPISYADSDRLVDLMVEEEGAWLSELDWDFAPIRQILTSFMRQKLLPGYVAIDRQRAIGYCYFLTHRAKAIIGTIYASMPICSQETADQIMTLAVNSLKASENIFRIEAQIIPFHNLNLNSGFTRHGFQCYPRYYLELDLSSYSLSQENAAVWTILPWNSSLIPQAAQLTFESYRDQTDSLICEDYCSLAGCAGYLRSLIENPGCGLFIPEASFMGLDQSGFLAGYVMSSRISTFSAMIPQIAISPSYQGSGLGKNLMHQALSQLKVLGFHNVKLTVTKKNRRAFEWYTRLGFRNRKEFGAFVWERESPS